MALAFFSPARPDPTPGTGAVSGVRLSTAPAQSPPPVERALVGEGFQVVKGAPVASRCRQRHALALVSVVLPADSRPSLFRHGEARTRAVRSPIVRQELTVYQPPHSWPPRGGGGGGGGGGRVSRRRNLGCFRRGVRAPKSERAQRPLYLPLISGEIRVDQDGSVFLATSSTCGR